MSEISDLKARVDWLERRLASVPVRWAKQDTLFLGGVIANGTEFIKPSGAASGVYGLKYKTGLATRTTVPDSIGTANYANSYDGLASISLLSGEKAWVIVGPCTDVSGTTYAATWVSAPVGQPIMVWSNYIIMATEGGGTAKVYRAYSV